MKRLLLQKDGQATIEFIVVGVVLMIAICALAVLWHMAADGKLAETIDSNASHDISNVEGVLDVAAY